MFIRRERRRLTGLRHDVTNIDDRSQRLLDRFPDFIDQDVRDDTRIETTRTKDDDVGIKNRLNRFRYRTDVLFFKEDPFDLLADLRNQRFTFDDRSVLELST